MPGAPPQVLSTVRPRPTAVTYQEIITGTDTAKYANASAIMAQLSCISTYKKTRTFSVGTGIAGMVCNWVADGTNDQQQLGEALAFMQDGDTLLVHTGTYNLGAQFEVTKKIRIIGVGVGQVTINVQGNYAGFRLTSTDCEISNITFSRGDASDVGSVCIDGANGYVHNCVFTGLYGGKSIEVAGENSIIRDCILSNSNGITFSNGGINVLVENCKIAGSKGIVLQRNIVGGNIKIINNYFSSSDTGVYFGSVLDAVGNGLDGVIIDGNQFNCGLLGIDFNQVGTNPYYGATNVKIANNTFSGGVFSTAPIRLRGVSNTVIANNTFATPVSSATALIELGQTTAGTLNCSYVSITGNVGDATGTDWAVNEASGSDYSRAVGNVFKAGDSGRIHFVGSNSVNMDV